MDRDELRRRIRRLSFASPALARAFSRGTYRSVFKGRGIEFDSLRDYVLDDDSRLVDWNATARTGRPFVRTYREDRSLALFLVIDASASMDQGSGECSKLDTAALTASLVAYAAQLRDMPVGCLVFSTQSQRVLPPRRGKAHACAVGAAALDAGSDRSTPPGRAQADWCGDGRALASGIEDASLILKRRSLVLVISDFRDPGWASPLGELRHSHDVVALRVTDASDLELPAAGSFRAVDPEDGSGSWLPLGSRVFRERWRRAGLERRSSCLESCAGVGVPVLEIDTAEDPLRALIAFFERRRTS